MLAWLSEKLPVDLVKTVKATLNIWQIRENLSATVLQLESFRNRPAQNYNFRSKQNQFYLPYLDIK